MSKTIAELESENAQLRRSNALLEEVVRRLLSEKTESTQTVAPAPQPQIVPVPCPWYPAPFPSPFPSVPSIHDPIAPYWTGPWWGITPPPGWDYNGVTCVTTDVCLPNAAGCAGLSTVVGSLS